MASINGAAHRSVSNIRPGANPGSQASPHTPLRTIPSTFGSPSALRAEEDCVIVELGSRCLKAGFAGDAVPKAVIKFGPEEQRRTGDYRRWERDYENRWGIIMQGKEWGEAHELWRLDLRGMDMGLIGDKIERAIREAFTKYLLIDSRPRRMALVLPSALPLPLLSTILDSLFTNFQSPTISLLSAPVLTTIAAGIRSGLVVDIGWAETVITGVYEYREVQCARSVRASKLLGEEMFKMLAEAVDPYASREDSVQTRLGERMRQLISFEVCEEVTARMAWCRSAKKREPKVSVQGLTPVKEEDEFRSSMRSLKISGEAEIDPVVSIPLNSTTPPKTLRLPFSKLADPCESALFAPGRSAHDLDDEELPLHLLVYRSLLQLPVDVRSICMSRIVFVGGGSKLLGLKGRILDEVAALIDERGWDPVQGKAVETLHDNPKLQRIRNRQAGIGPTEILREDNPSIPTTTSAAVVDQEPDPIEEQLKREASKGIKPIEHGHLRAVKSLGAWSGGSLLSQLKIPAVSIIDREQWLQYGATGASRTMEVNIATQRQSMGPSSFKPGAGERSSWTLGLWG